MSNAFLSLSASSEHKTRDCAAKTENCAEKGKDCRCQLADTENKSSVSAWRKDKNFNADCHCSTVLKL